LSQSKNSKQKLQPYFTEVNQDKLNEQPRSQAVGSSQMQGSNRQKVQTQAAQPFKGKVQYRFVRSIIDAEQSHL
jgi:hypothetical protein